MFGIRYGVSASSRNKINFANLILLVLQVILGTIVVGVYASIFSSRIDKTVVASGDNDLQNKLTLGITVGYLSVITAVVFVLIPALVSYYYVAIALMWDFVIFFIWCALFVWFKAIFAPFGNGQTGDANIAMLGQMTGVDLVNMLLWLTTALMSVVCFLHDRKSLRSELSGI